MIVVLCSVLFDLDGDVVIHALEESNLGQISRRVSKAKTLDGGVAITDRGATDSDRDLEIRWKSQSAAFEAKIKNLVKNHSQIYACTPDGCFLTHPDRYVPPARGISALYLMVKERADA